MRFRKSEDSPTCCELSWRPEGSVGFLFEFFGIFGLTIVVVKEREVCANSVINLIFLGMSCAQVTHHIEPDLRRPSDHALLIVDLLIVLKNICVCRIVLKHDSEEETAFLLSVNEGLSQLNFSSLDSTAGLNLLSKYQAWFTPEWKSARWTWK